MADITLETTANERARYLAECSETSTHPHYDVGGRVKVGRMRALLHDLDCLLASRQAPAEEMRERAARLVDERVNQGLQRTDDKTLDEINRWRAAGVTIGYERLANAIRALPLPEAQSTGGWMPTHRHYKGGLYREICRAQYAHSPDMVVVYDDAEGNIWARFAGVFDSTVRIDESGFGCVYIPRFARLPAPPGTEPATELSADTKAYLLARETVLDDPLEPDDELAPEPEERRAPSREEVEAMAKRLEAPAYWLCAGLGGERDDPYKAAALLRRLSTPSPATQMAVEALRPFAEVVAEIDSWRLPRRYPDNDKMTIRIGDIRRAAAALSALLAEGGGE